MKNFFKFLTINVRNGNFIASEQNPGQGVQMYVVATFRPIISRARDESSESVMRLMWPFFT